MDPHKFGADPDMDPAHTMLQWIGADPDMDPAHAMESGSRLKY